MQQARNRRRPWMRAFVLAAAVAAAPLPAWAGDSLRPAHPGPGIAASAQKAAVAAAATAKPARGVRMAQGQGTPKADLGSPSFFKSPAGIITLVAVGVGLGFALYSTSNDRVKSPNVDYGGGGR